VLAEAIDGQQETQARLEPLLNNELGKGEIARLDDEVE
jgi:hypothetical protein